MVRVGIKVGIGWMSVKGGMMGQGVDVGGIKLGFGEKVIGVLAWAFLFSWWAIRSQPPIKPMMLAAARVILALVVSLLGFRLGFEDVFIFLSSFFCIFSKCRGALLRSPHMGQAQDRAPTTNY